MPTMPIGVRRRDLRDRKPVCERRDEDETMDARASAIPRSIVVFRYRIRITSEGQVYAHQDARHWKTRDGAKDTVGDQCDVVRPTRVEPAASRRVASRETLGSRGRDGARREIVSNIGVCLHATVRGLTDSGFILRQGRHERNTGTCLRGQEVVRRLSQPTEI
mmetsp:Transcript_20455/g.64303  ORF Transcript_20455/g.64303 Transcript_20455/m.64303 type:complete len:163 (+) Transcript_20455:279-767(+)